LTVATFISRRKTRGFLDIQFSFRELSPILRVSLLGSTPLHIPPAIAQCRATKSF
jgi:hypothetical protein